MGSTWIIIIVSLFFSAFFSGMEIAFVSSSKLRVEIDKSKGTFISYILGIFYDRPDFYISTILVGNNIALVVYGIEMAHLLEPSLLSIVDNEALVAVLQTVISTGIILVTGEFIPKMLFRIRPNLWMNTFALPLLLFYIVLYPISMFTTALSNAIMRMCGVNVVSHDAHMPGKVDLDYLLQESVDNVDDKENIDNEVKIFQNALDFSKVKLRECMVPRTEIEAVEYDTPLEELTESFINSGYTKIIVYKENIDNIIGYIHTIELFRKPKKWQDKIIFVPVVPETMAANKLMNLMLLKKKSLAAVVDEFGGTAGIVTLEDIVEEIFGEIEDEHDTQEYVAKRISDDEFVLSGRLEIDYVNEHFSLDLPVSDDYNTVAGLILYIYQGFPAVKESVETEGYVFQILKATNNKIELVKLRKV